MPKQANRASGYRISGTKANWASLVPLPSIAVSAAGLTAGTPVRTATTVATAITGTPTAANGSTTGLSLDSAAGIISGRPSPQATA